MSAQVIQFPPPQAFRRPAQRLRVLLEGVHDYWSLREFTRDYVGAQREIDTVERAVLSRDMHQLWAVYGPETRSDNLHPRHLV